MRTDHLQHLPLEDLHREADARFGAFAGWMMPLSYPAGIMKEHLHTRERAGLFDISHMRLFEVSGRDAATLLDRVCPLDVGAQPLKQSKYSFLLNESAGILDDVIVTRVGNKRFLLVTNAGNAAANEAHLMRVSAELDVFILPLNRVFLALQGPQAEAVLLDAGLDVANLAFMTGVEPKPNWFVARSGYTGEDGFELSLPELDARNLLLTLLADWRVLWIGLAARDSLRLEAGLCLHGNDITASTNPVDAALMWAVPKSVRANGHFIGAARLQAATADGPVQKRVGLKPCSRQPVRGGAPLFDENGAPAGHVTSGGFGPSVGHPVAMGYVVQSLSVPGTRLRAEVRGSRIPVDVHPLPFTPHRYRKGAPA